MLLLLIACAAAVYLWHHAPALFMLLAAGGLLWYVVIPLCIIVVCGIGMLLIWGFVGLSWLANALPDIPGLTKPFAWEFRFPSWLWLPLGLGSFVLFTVLAHTMLPR